MINKKLPDTRPSTALCPYAKDILASKDFRPYQMVAQYEELQLNTGIDFRACIELIALLPVFTDGTEHKGIRKNMALRLQATKAQQEAAVVNETKRLLDGLFTKNNEIDLVCDFTTPLWHALSHSIMQRDKGLLQVVDDIPLLFITSTSLNKRKHINGCITAAMARYGDDIFMDLALASLGAKPFVGSLAMTFYDAVESHNGSRLCDIDLGSYLSNSSLRFIDRVAKRDVDIQDKRYTAGERVRCMTQSPTYSAEENAAHLYGAGAHLCLGKSIAQFTLDYLNQALKNYRSVVTVIEFQAGADPEPFSMPQFARIAIRV